MSMQNDFWATRRQSILQRLPQSTPPPAPPTQYAELYRQPARSTLLDVFATHFTALGGYFFAVADEDQLAAQLQQFCSQHLLTSVFCPVPTLQALLPATLLRPQPHDASASLTPCTALIAQHGSIFISATPTRTASALPDCHIVVAQQRQIVATLGDALNLAQPAESSMHSIISGASRTADIEKTLVMGAHGPKKICVFLLLSS